MSILKYLSMLQKCGLTEIWSVSIPHFALHGTSHSKYKIDMKKIMGHEFEM